MSRGDVFGLVLRAVPLPWEVGLDLSTLVDAFLDLSAMTGEEAMEDMNVHSFIPLIKLALGSIDIQIINIGLFEELTQIYI